MQTHSTTILAVRKGGQGHKMAVVSLVQRDGAARSFHIDRMNRGTVSGLVKRNVASESRLHTDESTLYGEVGGNVRQHETVNHTRKEYARGDVTTNTVEGYFSVFERGMIGTYQHVSERHLQRYLNEFDFRQSTRAKLGYDDDARTEKMVVGAEGRRLIYRAVVKS